MPKERTHWLLAQRAAAQLEPGPLSDAALAYGEFVLAGAVAHDAGYYAGALGNAAGQWAADRLHGNNGWNTFAPFSALASRRELGAPALAFGFGALTHLAADATFHPLVYAWTGDAEAEEELWRHGWLHRHQAMESALDLHLEALWGPAPVSRLATLVRAGGRDLAVSQSVFSGRDARPWMAAHARLQGWLGVTPARWLASLATWPVRGSNSDPTGVLYRGGPRLDASFEGVLRWVHPVTGAPDEATLEQLSERFLAMMRGLSQIWQRCWSQGTALPGLGPHLDTGLPSDRLQTKTRFTSPPWARRRLR